MTATTTSAAKLGLLAQLGADGVVMDGLDAVSVGEAVAKSQPDAIVHQMTAISVAHAGKPDFRHFDRWFATTSRLRTEGTGHLLAAAEAVGVSHFVAQGYASWNGIRQGGWVKTEEDPLDLLAGTAAQAGMEAIGHVEDVVVKAGGTAQEPGAVPAPRWLPQRDSHDLFFRMVLFPLGQGTTRSRDLRPPHGAGPLLRAPPRPAQPTAIATIAAAAASRRATLPSSSSRLPSSTPNSTLISRAGATPLAWPSGGLSGRCRAVKVYPPARH